MTVSPETSGPSAVPEFLSPEFTADPYAGYRGLREAAPLHWHEATGTYLVSRYQDVSTVFRSPTVNSDHYAASMEPIYGRPTLIQMGGHEHAVNRALVSPAFRGTLFRERYRPIIERNARELIDGFRDKGNVEFISAFAHVFPVTVICDMLGLDKNDQHLYRRWYDTIVAAFGNLTGDPEIAEAGVRTRIELTEYLQPVIRDRRANPRPDMISDLCAADLEGTTLEDADIQAFVALLLVAGGETTVTVLGLLLRNLLAHPEQLQAVRDDRSLIPAALAETLRMTPPVQLIQRMAGEPLELSGGTVPAGSVMTCIIGSANRDPEVFADPDTFDIHRKDLSVKTAFTAASDHVSFALGRHFCLGAVLTLTEVEVALDQLLDAMPDMRLAEGADPQEVGAFVRAIDRLELEFTPVAH